MNPTILETDALVLDNREHSESDLIVTLYSKDIGRVTAIAKGAKKSKRRFVNKLELFSFLQVRLRTNPTRSLALLEEADLHSGFIQLRRNLPAYTAATVIREFTLFGVKEGEEDQRIYSLLLWALHRLNEGDGHLRIVMLFLLRFLDYIGYRPDFGDCSLCGSQRKENDAYTFSTATGGVICRKCATHSSGQSGIHLSNGTMRSLFAYQDLPLKKLHRIQINEVNLYEALNILHRYGKHTLQRDIISWKMLRQTR